MEIYVQRANNGSTSACNLAIDKVHTSPVWKPIPNLYMFDLNIYIGFLD